MAGFDKVDPANPCYIYRAGRVHSWAGSRQPIGRIRRLIGNRSCARSTRKLPCSNDIACSGEPRGPARCACRPHESNRKAGSSRRRHKDSCSLRRISPPMCCRPMSSACIPRTGNSFFMAISIAPSPPLSDKGGNSAQALVAELEQTFPGRQDRAKPSVGWSSAAMCAAHARVAGHAGRLLGEPRPAAGNRRTKSAELSRAG